MYAEIKQTVRTVCKIYAQQTAANDINGLRGANIRCGNVGYPPLADDLIES
jgi:hypothetical protein